MQLSRFNLWVNDYPSQGEHLLFNTRTQALLKINSEFKQTLDRLAKLKEKELSLVTRCWLQALKENGMLVKDAKEEAAKLDDFFHQVRYESRVLPFEATILTTYACNFKCTYCFEESVRDDVFLDNATSDAIVDWLIERAEKRKYKKVSLVFYGGEPLLNVRPIYDISWHLRQWAEEKEVEFNFGIITNGSLINPDLIDKFLTVGLKTIRVSIDGGREAHNKKRPFSDGQPTFDLLIDNIKGIIDKVNVGIVGNFDQENFSSLPGFLDYLEKEGLLYKLSKIDFLPLTPRLGPRSDPGAFELKECLSYVDGEKGLFKEVLAIKKELLRRKLKTNVGLAVNACALLMQDGGVTIDPKGVIYKCNAMVGYPQFSIGHVSQPALNEKHREYLGLAPWEKCPSDCSYVPMCQGGCRFYSYLENDNLTDLSCKKDYFDRIIPELIKLEYHKNTL